MKPQQVMEALEVLISAKQPVHLWGGPGIGKSDVVRAVARKMNRQLIDVRAVLLDPVDLRGLPHVNGDSRAHWCIPDFLPREGSGILFLDELNRAPMLVQNACLQLVLDRKIGEYTLPDGWDVAAAGNRLSDGGGVTKMNSALSIRFRHLDFDPDLEDWTKWAIGANIEPVVIAFVRFRTELLYKFEAGERTFPCPRTHEAVSKIVARNPSPAIEHDLYRGAYGDGAAVEFSAFMTLYRELPSIDSILLDPKHAPLPEKPASLFAVSCALGRRASVENFERIVQYLNRLPAEYAVMSVKDAVARDAGIASTPTFCKWAIKHSDVVF
jgi:ATPase family associated with various cellular activities (AAA)